MLNRGSLIKTTIIFLFLFVRIGKSQRYIDSTDYDNFKHSFGWQEYSNDIAEASIKKDGYIVEHKVVNGNYAFFKSFNLDYTKNFSFEVPISLISGVKDYGHGLLFGMKDWDNYNSFIISPMGYFTVASYQNKKTIELQPWKKVDIINENGENNLKIENINGKIYFFVNNKLAFITDNNLFNYAGNIFGIAMYSQKELSIPYVKVKGSFEKINLVPNAIRGNKRLNLGTNINSPQPDICPVISPDGKTIFFARKNESPEIRDEVWVSSLSENGEWLAAKNIGAPINNAGNNNVISVSADNNLLFLTNTYNKDGSVKGAGISVSTRTGNNWSLPQDIKIENYYNDFEYVNNCFSADNKYLLQSIQRKDSYGGADIYVSFKNQDGSYSEPINLGKTINTAGYETTPFISADNKTLYYSTDGLPGYGSNDIFVTRRLDDTWKNWSEPQNLGPEINTEEWDAYFTVPASGEEAYMVTQKKSIGNADIVKVQLSAEARPKPVVLVTGKVLNKKTNQPLSATINYFDLKTNEQAGSAISNQSTGDYNIILQSGKEYGFRAEQDLFYAINDLLDVKDLTNYKEIKKDLYLVPIEVGQSIRLNNIFFDFNKSTLKPESNAELDRLVNFLTANKKIEIEIGGHTDNVGTDEYNIKLSQQRSESVANYLILKGINPSRLQTKGYGKNKPVVNNDTDEGKTTNRRVEFTILKQ